MTAFRVAVAQFHSPTGDYERGCAALNAAVTVANDQHVDLLVTPALALPGPHARDARLDPAHLRASMDTAKAIIATTGETLVAAIGLATATPTGTTSALAVGARDTMLTVGNGTPHPGYVTDPTVPARTLRLNGVPVTLSAGWPPEADRDAIDPRTMVTVIADAEPYRHGGPAAREHAVAGLARHLGTAVVYVNAVGAHDGLVFPGGSVVIAPSGKVLLRAPLFEEGTFVVDIPVGDIPERPVPVRFTNGHPAPRPKPVLTAPLSSDEEVYTALVRGLRDYVNDNRFPGVILGLSGGVDSALVACVAVDALGADRVRGLSMPGPYSSESSINDAKALAAALGVRMDTAPITDVYEAEVAALGTLADGPGAQVARENIQSRLRALHLMTVANVTGAMLLNTGNKSEAAVGYFTLGGDSMGGLAPIADLVKGRVYDLCRWRNAVAVAREEEPPVPESTLTKPPSAELAPDQQDSDSLPPYDVLDAVVTILTERRDPAAARKALVDAGHDPQAARDVVDRVRALMARSEHKRGVAPPAIRVTPGAFGHDLHPPITASAAPA